MKFTSKLLLTLVIGVAQQISAAIFNRPSPDTIPRLPQSMGALPEFNLGWHWFMANFRLQAADGSSFLAGLQVSPLRFTFLPWLQASQAYVGQVALTRQEGPGYYDYFESSLLPNSAGTITSEPFQVAYSLGGASQITIKAAGNGQGGTKGTVYYISASFTSQANNQINATLIVQDRSGIFWQGDHGYLQTGALPSSAFYYFTLPDLVILQGTVVVGSATYTVVADQQYSGARLGMQYQTRTEDSYWGWDWAPVMLTTMDGQPLAKPLCLSLSHERQNSNPNSYVAKYSHGAWLQDDGSTYPLIADQNYFMTFLDYAGSYPNNMLLTVTVPQEFSAGLLLSPLVPGSVFKGKKPFAENPATVSGWLTDKEGIIHQVTGIAWGEHAGYDGNSDFSKLFARPESRQFTGKKPSWWQKLLKPAGF